MVTVLHNVWVNWVDENCVGHEVPDFHEWRENDLGLEIMDDIPLFFVDEEFVTHVENSSALIPEGILKKARGRSYRRAQGTKHTAQVEYAMVFTDRKRIIAVESDEDGVIQQKSRLTAEKQVTVFSRASPMEKITVTDVVTESSLLENFQPYFTVKEVIGLTRRERTLKELLDAITAGLYGKSEEEVKYWYEELFPATHLDKIGMIMKIEESFRVGWSERHEKFGTTLVKYMHQSIQDAWNEEINYNVKEKK
jgi:Protein of unknown function (DUF3603)